MMDEKTRRPICFVFSGNTNEPDGKNIFLESDELENSVNYQLMLMILRILIIIIYYLPHHMKNFIKHLLRPNQMIKDIGHKEQLNLVLR
jgi:hypothetical protein